MIKAFLIFLCVFVLIPSNAAKVAVGTASAEIISVDQPRSVKTFELSSQSVQLMSTFKKDGCVQYYFISSATANNNTSQKFGTCSGIVRTKVIGDSIIVSMPKNDNSGFSTHIFNSELVKEISKE